MLKLDARNRASVATRSLINGKDAYILSEVLHVQCPATAVNSKQPAFDTNKNISIDLINTIWIRAMGTTNRTSGD